MEIFKNRTDEKGNIFIDKYKIIIDKGNLDIIRYEVVKNCSIVKHIECELEEGEIFRKKFDERIKNLQKGDFIQVKEYYDSSDVERYYMCSYDELEFSPLVKIIDLLLSDDLNALDMLNKVEGERINSLDYQINKVHSELYSLDNAEDQIQKLSELNELLHKKILNKNVKDDIEYYDKVKDCIHYELDSSISMEELNVASKVIDFFNSTKETKKYIKKFTKETI